MAKANINSWLEFIQQFGDFVFGGQGKNLINSLLKIIQTLKKELLFGGQGKNLISSSLEPISGLKQILLWRPGPEAHHFPFRIHFKL